MKSDHGGAAAPDPTPKRQPPLHPSKESRALEPVSMNLKRTSSERPCMRSADLTMLSPDLLRALRHRMAQEIGWLPTPGLNPFVCTFLINNMVVQSYHHQRTKMDEIEPISGQSNYANTFDPLVEAKKAAMQAVGSSSLQGCEHERAVAWVAAWAYPVGLFHLSHPRIGQLGLSWKELDRARAETRSLVANAVQAARNENTKVGHILGAILGTDPFPSDVNDRMARIGTAVYLAQRRIHTLWLR